MATAFSAGRAFRAALVYAAAALVGATAYTLHMPLAWILGPLLAAAVFSIYGFDYKAPLPLRRGGQVVIGTTIGLNVTATVAASLPGWIGPVIITALFAVLVTAALSVGFARLAGVDRKTAFFALMPGGLAEMGNIGASVGARMEPIAIAQALRVALIVFLIPPLLFAAAGTFSSRLIVNDPLPWTTTCALLLVGGFAALVASKLRLNNPWAIGPLIMTAILTSTNVTSGHMRPAVFFGGQILLGVAIGSLFRRSLLRQLPRVVAAGSVFVVVALVVMAAFGILLAYLSGLDTATAILSASPGGMAEMAATAQMLHVGTAIVAIFHVGRALLVNAFATYYWAFLLRIGFFDAIGSLGARIGRLL